MLSDFELAVWVLCFRDSWFYGLTQILWGESDEDLKM